MGDARQREFQHLGGPLAGLLARFDRDGRLQAYRVWDFWEEVVGAAIAARATPQRLRDATLIVQVSTHTWMQELQFLKEDIRARLNQRLGAPLIADLQFVLGHVRERPVEEEVAPPAPVAVPDLPPTGSPELDEILRRVATAAARHRAARAPRKKGRRR